MILLDTNVATELGKQRPHDMVRRWATTAKPPFAFSAVSVEEVRYGLAWKSAPRAEHWIGEFLVGFCEIFPVTEAIANRAGTLRGRFRANGQTRSQADMLIAATALEHQFALATRNTRDFLGCGVALVNPFAATVIG